MKLLILIPCFNTHQYLNKLILNIRETNNEDILIYDDGSSPPLSLLSNNQIGIKLLRNNINKGKGNVLKKGFEYARNLGYSHVLTLDGDMQHNPIYINNFISSLNNTDLVLGAREFKSPMPLHRILSNSITSFIISTLLGKKINDAQCGFRLYSLKLIKNYSINEDGYLYESEVLLKCINKKTIIVNVPIDTIYSGSKSHIHNLKDTMKFIRMLIRYLFA